jgi:hypothetical protein
LATVLNIFINLSSKRLNANATAVLNRAPICALKNRLNLLTLKKNPGRFKNWEDINHPEGTVAVTLGTSLEQRVSVFDTHIAGFVVGEMGGITAGRQPAIGTQLISGFHPFE